MTKGAVSLQMTCFKVVCLSCLCRHCVRVWGSDTSAPALTGLRLTDSEKVVCPQYKNKSSISCFVRRRLCLTSSGDCQVTFRKPTSFYLFAMLKLYTCHFSLLRPFPLLLRNKFIVIRNAVPRLNGFCLKWDLREWARERERDREPRAAERLDE